MAASLTPALGEEKKPTNPESTGFTGSDTDDGSAASGIESRFVEMTPELKAAFEKVKKSMQDRDLVSRRMQVRDAWQQRYFDRGNQHLVQGPYGQWGYDGEKEQCGRNAGTEENGGDENNIYQAYRLQLTGVLTQNTPSVRFFPKNKKSRKDQMAASAANTAKQIIEKTNNCISIQEDIVRYLYTDGLAVICEEYDDKAKEQRMEVLGTLECKLPIQEGELKTCLYAIISKEADILVAKNKFASQADRIKGSVAPAAESEFERLARVSCMQGMRPSALTGDSLQWNVTLQRTYLKPDAYMAITDKEVREQATLSFPEGVCLYHAGAEFMGARPARMDDELTLIHAYSGDGMHRNSIGYSVVPIQEKLNDAVELMQQTLMNTIPVKWTHPSYVDLAALSQQENLPGSYLKLAAIPPNGDLSNAFYIEEQLEVPQVFLQWITELRDNFPQLLTGAYPALTGAGDLGGNDTAQGIATERDAAMGRIGAIWRNMKEGYGALMKNAVICIRENADEDTEMSATVMGRGGIMKSLSLNVDDLRGEISVFPETEEAFPESWVQKRGVYMSLMSSPDPQIEATANLPENLVLAKEIIGVENFYIPQVVSRNKQLAEIDEMMQPNVEPLPNPALQAIDEQAQPMIQQAQSQQQQTNQVDPNLLAELQKLMEQAEGMPPEVSSVDVDKDYDDHVTEDQTVTMFLNSEEGQQLKQRNPPAFQNIRLHGLAHRAAAKQLAAENAAPPPTKPPSTSVNIKDLIAAGMTQQATQLAAKAGLTGPPPIGVSSPPAAAPPIAA